MDKRIILISGKKRSGKDFTGAMVVEKLTSRGYKVESLSYAKPLKDYTCTLLGLSPIELETRKNIDGSFERLFLQRLGVLFRDEVNTNYWVNTALDNMKKSHADVIIVTDCRFPNEIVAVGDVFTSLTMRIESDDVDLNDTHESETALDEYPFDVHVFNEKDESLDSLIEVILTDFNFKGKK